MESTAAARARNRKATLTSGARKIAYLLEKHMSEQGLTEREKSAKVKQFAARVANATRLRAKS